MPSMMFDSLLQILPSLGSLAVTVLGLCASLLYLSKTRKCPAAGGLMVAGMLVFLLVSASSILWQLYMDGNAGHPRSVDGFRLFFSIQRIVTVAGRFIFYLGLLLMALRTPVQDVDP